MHFIIHHTLILSNLENQFSCEYKHAFCPGTQKENIDWYSSKAQSCIRYSTKSLLSREFLLGRYARTCKDGFKRLTAICE